MKLNHVVLSALFVSFISQASFAKEYKIDATHSNVGFVAQHLVSKVNGEFKEFEGTVDFDAKKPENTKVKASAKTASVTTNVEKRDSHLKSPDFFDSKKFPTMTFVSTKVSEDGSKKYKMTGDLTIKGVTKSVTFDVDFLGEMDDPWGGHRAGFTATGKINRKDFGINWNKALDKGGFVLADDVTINLNVEAAADNAEKKK
jgi:polyisoprenoid-binding protein YceI